jgi:hypothetical protein
MLEWRHRTLNREARVKLPVPVLLVAFAALAGCSADRNVTGRLLGSGETFTGTATPGGLLSGGSMSLRSSSGARCEGRSMSSETVGSTVAVLTCDDGRAGSVILLDGPSQSVGSGVLGTDKMTLTITK